MHRDFEGVQKDNEKAVSEMRTLADSFEKEVTEEGELEPSARCACLQHLSDIPAPLVRCACWQPVWYLPHSIVWAGADVPGGPCSGRSHLSGAHHRDLLHGALLLRASLEV